MNKVILDQDFATKLAELTERTALCDAAGHVVGYFRPCPSGVEDEYDLDAVEVSDDELDRIEQHLDGRPLPRIMKELKAKS